MNSKNLIITLLCASTIVTACSKNKRVETNRTLIPDLGALGVSEPALIISPLASSIEDQATPGACERLSVLRHELAMSNDSLAPRFSFVSELFSDKKGLKAAVEIDESPFTQLFLGEKFQVDDEETFYKKAKAEREAGNIGFMKWMVVKFMKAIGSMKTIQYPATNDKLEEAFPGIFGEAVGAEKSLSWKIAQRAADSRAVSTPDTSEILTTRVQLFPGNGSWNDYETSQRTSLAAAAKAYKGGDQKEKLCAMILMQQNFAQLLRIKGHNAPVSLAPARGKKHARIEKLSSSNPAFQKREIPGAFFDVLSKRSIVLENESIKTYDPAQKRVSVTSQVPSGSVSYEAGKLNDALSLMEALLHSYEATSPAASWLKSDEDYVLGDILVSEKAILPAEAHALALGLMTVHFKNLAALNIKKVDKDGRDASLGGMPAGILLASDSNAANVYRVRLVDAIRFARVVFYFDNALRQFSKKQPGEWQAMNPSYDLKTMASLFGTTVFTKEQLEGMYLKQEDISQACIDAGKAAGREYEECLLSERKLRAAIVENLVKGNSLRDNLRALKLPLAMLLSQLGTGRAGCVVEVEWDAISGRRVPGAACAPETKGELADLFEIMARDTRSPVLLKKARDLRGQ